MSVTKKVHDQTQMWQKGARKVASEARRIARFDYGIDRLVLSWDDGTRQPSAVGSDHVLHIAAGGKTARLRVGVCTLGDILVDAAVFEDLRKVLARKIRQLA